MCGDNIGVSPQKEGNSTWKKNKKMDFDPIKNGFDLSDVKGKRLKDGEDDGDGEERGEEEEEEKKKQGERGEEAV